VPLLVEVSYSQLTAPAQTRSSRPRGDAVGVGTTWLEASVGGDPVDA
jgi:hypothetical protein